MRIRNLSKEMKVRPTEFRLFSLMIRGKRYMEFQLFIN